MKTEAERIEAAADALARINNAYRNMYGKAGKSARVVAEKMIAAYLDGDVVVPREPTEKMVAAAEECLFEHLPDALEWSMTMAKEALRSGIAAATPNKDGG